MLFFSQALWSSEFNAVAYRLKTSGLEGCMKGFTIVTMVPVEIIALLQATMIRLYNSISMQ